jgi:protein-lysine N-methyltransferase EEF2KMT
MSLAGAAQPPSSTLPPIRSLSTSSEQQIKAALHNLQSIYCPLRLPVAIHGPSHRTSTLSPPTPADSGYVSRDETPSSLFSEECLQTLRADPFERETTIRWLTALISRAELIAFSTEETREAVLDDAAFILSSFSDAPPNDEPEDLTRDFCFPSEDVEGGVKVQLNDAPLSGTDHTDVGLQSWGAAIVLSEMLCAHPERFSLTRLSDASSVIELGAGTGLVSLTLAKLLSSTRRQSAQSATPHVLATDYHAAVLENLRTNIATNFPGPAQEAFVKAMQLDWACPPSMDRVEMLIAADVVYDRSHAVMLRDCASKLLTRNGTFWLMATVREVGKFEGIAQTVEPAFEDVRGGEGAVEECLRILRKAEIGKRKGIGRGDEVGYVLYEIGWI